MFRVHKVPFIIHYCGVIFKRVYVRVLHALRGNNGKVGALPCGCPHACDVTSGEAGTHKGVPLLSHQREVKI